MESPVGALEWSLSPSVDDTSLQMHTNAFEHAYP